jgi:hypothetical protein
MIIVWHELFVIQWTKLWTRVQSVYEKPGDITYREDIHLYPRTITTTGQNCYEYKVIHSMSCVYVFL